MHDAVARACEVLQNTEIPEKLWEQYNQNIYKFSIAVAQIAAGKKIQERLSRADCKYCNAKQSVISKIMQTRSADEGMTHYNSCTVCGKLWTK